MIPLSRISALGALTASALLAVFPVQARERAPLPDTAFDGGVVSAETLGRGATTASNRGTAASGSENPASLEMSNMGGSLYATTLVSTRSKLPDDVANASDPLRGKVIQYLAVGADRGVLFFEPLSRLHQTQVVDEIAGTTREVELHANALGFAGAQKMRNGSVGLSFAYVWSAMSVTNRTGAAITDVTDDTSDGLRMNLGLRYPTGPAMWGLVVQNAPGLLWGSDFRHNTLPLRIRVGNTYRLSKGVLLSIDGERRFYHEGGHGKNFVYVGNETFIGQVIVLRAGAFGESLNSAEERTLTAGLSFIARDSTQLSYAFQQYELPGGERVKRTLVSLSMPFQATDSGSGASRYK